VLKFLTSNKGEILKYIFFSFFVIIFYCENFYTQDIRILSLQTYSGDDQTSLPIYPTGGGITIEFDAASTFQPSMSIVFRFCDKNWNPTNNVFLYNSGKDIARDINFTVLPNTVKSAHFHFKGKYPDKNKNVTFPFAGKWKFFVTDISDTSKVYAIGKFIVVSREIPISVKLKNDQLEGKNYFPKVLANVFNITTSFILPSGYFSNYIDHVEIIENHKIDYPTIVDRTFNTSERQFYWDGSKNFTFTARDIQPGNEYRQTDLRDINKFNSENVRAQFTGIEYSNFYKELPGDLNGGEELTNYNNAFATYLNVDFSIRPPDDVAGNVFLVGSFNNWELSPDYRMNNNAGLYDLTVQLKRGVYDYQYVLADYINGEIKNADWLVLEGNSWDTKNEYNVFLYYHDPSYGGYDRIVGYAQLIKK
jgi:hypothetical protein